MRRLLTSLAAHLTPRTSAGKSIWSLDISKQNTASAVSAGGLNSSQSQNLPAHGTYGEWWLLDQLERAKRQDAEALAKMKFDEECG